MAATVFWLRWLVRWVMRGGWWGLLIEIRNWGGWLSLRHPQDIRREKASRSLRLAQAGRRASGAKQHVCRAESHKRVVWGEKQGSRCTPGTPCVCALAEEAGRRQSWRGAVRDVGDQLMRTVTEVIGEALSESEPQHQMHRRWILKVSTGFPWLRGEQLHSKSTALSRRKQWFTESYAFHDAGFENSRISCFLLCNKLPQI